jgi:anaerobic sulfite reductase subunit B
VNIFIPKSYEIQKIIKYTPDVKLLKVRCNLNPLPGQFIEVSVPGIGECPLASCSYDPKSVDMLIKNVGNVTSAIFQLEKNNKIFIRGPYGKGFPFNKFKGKNLILIAGGTGIAPITSMISYILKNKKEFKKIKIYLGFRDEKHILLKERIKNWKEKLDVTITLDKLLEKSDNLKCTTGFIQDIITNIDFDTKKTVALLCGSEIMMQCATDKLLSLGIPKTKIYWSLERRMECGFGSCNRCLIQDVYVCREGPIFRYYFIKSRLDNENSSNVS